MSLADEYLEELKTKYTYNGFSEERDAHYFKQVDMAYEILPLQVKQYIDTWDHIYGQCGFGGSEFFSVQPEVEIDGRKYKASRYENPCVFEVILENYTELSKRFNSGDFSITNVTITFEDNSIMYLANNAVYIDNESLKK